MAWLTNFLLGRPGYEYAFSVNPGTVDIDEAPIAAVNRLLNGDLKKGILKASAPSIRIASNFLPLAERDKLASVMGLTDTLLSFQVRDDWTRYLEYNLSATTTTVQLQNSSMARLDAALTGLGKSALIQILGVFANPDGSGTNYYSVGSTYSGSNRTVTVATAFPSANTGVYVSYTYKGWLVDMTKNTSKAQAGFVDTFGYDIQLDGA